jgi:hypothetical protein
MFIVKIMKYPIYMSLSYNSPDFQYRVYKKNATSEFPKKSLCNS